ncbi:MAG: hypothetical protein R6X16_07230 [Anaerolineae bacterium]
MMRDLLKHVMSFENVNWWLLAGGLALNVIIAAVSTIAGAALSMAESTAAMYASYGAPLMLLAVFLACLLAGALISRMADDVPMRHAFLSSLGAAVAFLLGALFTLNYVLLMVAVIAIAGNLNGAMLALPKPHAPRRD